MIMTVENINRTQYWTLDHPSEGNSLGLKMHARILEALTPLESESQKWLQSQGRTDLNTRALVIQARATSDQTCPIWIAGGNLRELSKLRSKASGRDYIEKMRDLCRRLSLLPIPVIFSIHGKVIGGGAEFTLFGDFRLATATSRFYFKQLFVGLSCSYGSTERLRALVGQGRAWSMLGVQQALDADQALNWGLLHSVHADKNQLQDGVRSLLTQLEAIDPMVYATQKMMFNAKMTPTEDEDSVELDLIEGLWMQPPHKNYLDRFLNSKP